MQKRGWVYYFASLLIIFGVVGHEVIPHHHHSTNSTDFASSCCGSHQSDNGADRQNDLPCSFLNVIHAETYKSFTISSTFLKDNNFFGFVLFAPSEQVLKLVPTVLKTPLFTPPLLLLPDLFLSISPFRGPPSL